MGKRDYNPFGTDAKRAVESGLTAAEWYHTDVPRKVMKDLMARSDGPAIRDTILLYGLMLAFAAGGIATWGSLWTIPFWLAYGVLYGSASDSRWHECSHGTAFRTPWMNNAVYQISSFMIMRNPATWRWSHARHHSETYLVGRDPEIAVMRPPELAKLILNFFGVLDVLTFFPRILRNAISNLDAGDDKCINVADTTTGICAYNAVGGRETDNSTDQITCGTLVVLIQNYSVDQGDRQGVLDPVATT